MKSIIKEELIFDEIGREDKVEVLWQNKEDVYRDLKTEHCEAIFKAVNRALKVHRFRREPTYRVESLVFMLPTEVYFNDRWYHVYPSTYIRKGETALRRAGEIYVGNTPILVKGLHLNYDRPLLRYEDAKDKELVLEQLKSRLEVFLEETFIPNIQAELESAAI